MLSKLRTRLTYANVMSSIAVFLALTGGTAVALSGTNTVFSDDIVDSQVKEPDLGDVAVTNRKLGDNAVSPRKVLDNSLAGGDVKNDSLTGEDINESSLVGALRGAPGPTFGSFGGADPRSSPSFIAPASSPALRREFTTPSAGRLLVEAHYKKLFVNCSDNFASGIGLYVDGVPVPGTWRLQSDQAYEDYSAIGLTDAKVAAGSHVVAIGVECTTSGSPSSIGNPLSGHSIGAVLLGG